MTKKTDQIVKRVALFIGIWCVAALILCGIMAGVISAEIVPYATGRLVLPVLADLLLCLLCYVAVRKIPKSRLLFSLVIAVVVAGVRFLARTLIGADRELLSFWWIALPFIAAVSAGCMASMKKKRRR